MERQLISRYGPLCFLALLNTVAAPAPAAGQPVARVGVGLTLGRTANMSEGFANDQHCPQRSATSASARLTFALTRVIQLEALAEEFYGRGIDCINGLVPPVPPTGPYTRINDYYDGSITDPPTVLALRVGGSLPKSGAFTLRPYVGIAHFAGKSITSPQAGLTVLGGGSPLSVLLEAEGWWYSVPRQHLEEEHVDGRLVRRILTEQGVRAFTTIFRLGFTSSGPRS